MTFVVVVALVVALATGAAATTTTPRPTSLTATAGSATTITLHWIDRSSNEIGFEVQRSPARTASWKKVATSAANATSYTDAGLAPATAYKYRVRALKPVSGASAFSNTATATTMSTGGGDHTAPTVPANVHGVAPTCSTATVSWDASADSGGAGLKDYALLRDGVVRAYVTRNTANDTGLLASHTYTYSVEARDNALNVSAASAGVAITTPACNTGTTLPVPTGFTALTESCAFATTSWNPVYDPSNTYKITKYNIYRNGTLVKSVGAPTSTAVDTPLAAHTTYTYAVSAADASGNESARSTTATVTTTACPPAGAWAKTAGGAGSETSNTVAVDAAGDTIIGGFFRGTADLGDGPIAASANGDIFVAKFSAAHVLLWVNHYASNGAAINNLNSVAADSSGNVFAVGAFYGTMNTGAGTLVDASSGYTDAFVVKYSPAGVAQWSRRYGDVDTDYASDLAVDSTGDIVVTGWFRGTGVDFGGPKLSNKGGTFGGADPFVVKLASANAATLLAFSIPCGGASAYGIALDAANNMFVTGSVQTACNFGGGVLPMNNTDAFLAKYTPAGSYVWAKTFGAQWLDQGRAVAVDRSGNVVVTGVFAEVVDFGTGPIGQHTWFPWAFVAKFTGGGTPVWSKAFGNQFAAYGYGVTVDASGNVTVVGAFSGTVDFGGGPLSTGMIGTSEAWSAFVAEFSPAGAYIAADRYGNGTNDQAFDVATSTDGAVVTGAFAGTTDFGFGPVATNGFNDIFIVNTGR